MQLQRVLAADFADHDPAGAARVIEALPAATASAVLTSWRPEVSGRVLAASAPHAASAIAGALSAEVAARALATLDRFAAAQVLRRASAEVRTLILAEFPDDVREPIASLLRYEADSAGAHADADVLCVPASLTAAAALRRVRSAPSLAHHTVIAIDDDGRLAGVFNLRMLFAARPRSTVAELMTREVHSLPASATLPDIVRHPGWRTVTSLPVLDDERRPIGVMRWRRAREIEERLLGEAAPDGGEAARALGDLFSAGLSGALDAITMSRRGDGGGNDGP